MVEKIHTFSQSIDTSFYSNRNQFNKEKRIKDQVVGKMGEFAIFSTLKPKFQDISEPDLNIYPPNKKTWDFDLKAQNPHILNMHVKSQTLESGNRYGVSWIFQNTDKEIFNSSKKNQYVGFVSVNNDTSSCFIRAIVKLEHLHENKLFKMPKLQKLQESNKLAVYFDDLKKFDLFQLEIANDKVQ